MLIKIFTGWADLKDFMKKNSMYFFLGLILLSITSVSGVLLNSGMYEAFGWKPFSAPSKNVTVSFSGMANSDLHLAIRYATNQYVEVVIGGWGNGRGAVRNCTGSNGTATIYVDAPVYPGNMPTQYNYVAYVVTIANSMLRVTANGREIISYTNAAFLNNSFNAYSFRANMPNFPWNVMNDVGTSVGAGPAVPAAPAIPAGTFTGTNVPSGFYWLQKPNGTQFLDQTGTYWGMNKHVFRITRNATNLSYASVSYPSNAGALAFSDTQFWYVTAPAPVVATVFQGACSGYTATSTVSQAQADALARNNWLNAKLPGGTVLTAENYTTFQWRPISPASNNVRLSFSAAATNDIIFAFQYASSSFVEIAVGGWNNTQSTVRNCPYGTSQGENLITNNPRPIPNTVDVVSYLVTIAPIPGSSNSQLNVTANGINILSFSAPFLNQTLTAYSFRCWTTAYWKVSNFVASSVATFTGYYPNSSTSGYFSKTSTVSQYEADRLARDAWLSGKIPTGTTINSAAYTVFTWKPITSGPSNNIRIQWTAAASTNITVGLQYSASQYIEVVIGGWRNNTSTVRNFTNGSFPGENLVPFSSGAPIRDTFNPVTYVLTVAPSGSNGVVTVTSNGLVILSFTAPFLKQVFTHYSFSADAQAPWRIASGEVVSSVPMVFTSTYSGYTATSTVSQVDADNKAQQAWQIAVLANIASSKATASGMVTPLLNQITAANNLLIAARGSLKNVAVQLNYLDKLPWE